MPWSMIRFYSTLFISLIADWLCCAQGLRLPPIHWNASNPMFKFSANDHIIEVRLRDEVDIICPYYGHRYRDIDNQYYEYYIVHEVTKEEYETCRLDTLNGRPRMIVNCSSPTVKKFFTIWFEPFTPIPNVPEFKEGETYYFITTSTGDKYGLANTARGACINKNMKITFKISKETTTPTTTQPSRTTTIPTTTTTTATTTTTTIRRPSVHWTSTPSGQRTRPTTMSTTTKIWMKDKTKENQKEKDLSLVSSGSEHRFSMALLGCTSIIVLLLRGLLSR